MPAAQRFAPVVLLLVAFLVASRFLQEVRTVDAVGLFGCGALAGVSLMRLLAVRQPRRSDG